MSQALSEGPLCVELENIGGIEHAEADLPPGVTVLSGRNATNRTSFLQGIMATVGSSSNQISLKSDTDEGQATLRLGDETYTRTIERAGGTTMMNGEPFTDESELLDLYAFLLKDNPVRQTIERNGDLHEVLMRPIDTDEIEAELQQLRAEKENIEAELEQLDEYKQRIPKLEEQRTQLETELDDLRTTEAEIQERKETLEAQFDETASDEKPERVQELEEELTSQRTEVNTLKRKLDQQRNLQKAAIDDLEAIDKPDAEEAELRAERDRLEAERERLADQIDTIRSQRQEITSGMEAARTLQDSMTSIEEAVGQLDVDIDLPEGPLTATHSGESGDLTDTLVEGEQISCLACGSQVTTDTVDAVIDQYREINTAFREQINALESDQQEVRSQLKEVESQLDQWERAEKRLAEAERQKEQTETRIETYEERLEEAKETVADLEDGLEAAREDAATEPDEALRAEHAAVEDDLIDTEVAIRQAETKLDDIESTIADLETELEAEDRLSDQRDELVDEIERLHSHVEDTERKLVEEFNQTIDTVLELLGYANIERIWIERKRKDVKVGRRTEEQTVFELNIVREGGNGVYADDLQHLSESERSVTGLVVALTGYIVHDVADLCPIMLLDSVEMIDSERIAQLIDYFADETEYLVAALLPEDSAEVNDSLLEATLMKIDTKVK
ncbi:archaea-specific SMC-related protein [Natronomonas salsuginis]|uniref:Chromosome segregation protein SMC n=1 Tax=Natronomonas salsuginis TaxID=2217661 RepID=A0A4U5JB52_9EURY|nr:archaea-specific SMC-related protein [Natronomonas salsuginis]TKR25058.1 chromosome segregation protein SMC [Natronomonas salsuginis]